MSTKADILRVRMVADGGGKVRAEILGVDNSVQKLEKSSLRLGSSLTSLRGAAAIAFASWSVAKLSEWIGKSIEAGDEIQKLTLRIGASAEALSEYKHVSELSGLSFDTLTQAWQRMTRRVAEAAQGTGEAKDALKELNLSAEELAKLKPEDQFEVIADRLSGITSEGDRVRLAMKLFDSEGVRVLQTMERGAEGIREMREEARRLGLTLDQEAVEKMARAKDATARLHAAMNGMANEIAVNLAPELERTVNLLADSIPESIGYASKVFNGLVSDVQTAAEWFAAYQEGHISFTEWLFSGGEEARNRLAEIRQSRGLLGITDGYQKPSLPSPQRGAPLDLQDFNYDPEKDIKAVDAQRKELEKARAAALAYRQTLSGNIDELRLTFLNERELIEDGYAKNLLMIEEAYDERVIKDKDYYELKEALEKQHQQAIAELMADGVREREEYAKRLTQQYNVADAVTEELSRIEDAYENGRISAEVYFDAIADQMDRLDSDLKETTDIMTEFGVQAARNMQSILADYLFDPFSEGLDGLAQKFSQMLARMASEIVAQQILNAFFGWLSGTGGISGEIGQMFVGGISRDYGGPVTAGLPYHSGVDEVFVPKQDGYAIPTSMMTQAKTYNVNISFPGVRNPAEFQQSRKQIMNDIRRTLATLER